MLWACIVYVFIMIIMMICSYANQKVILKLLDRKFNVLYNLLPILLITFLLGTRYGVGIDFFTYKYCYETNDNAQFEILYRWLSNFLYSLDFSFYILLSITVGIYYVFFYLAFSKMAFILPYCVLFFMALGPFTFELNGIRQAISFSIFLYSIHFMKERSFFKYLLLILIATGVHAFSLILILLYLLVFFDTNKQIPILLIIILYILSVVAGEYVFSVIVNLLAGNLKELGYGTYIENFGEIKMEYGTGIGMKIMQSLDIALIFYSNKLKKEYLSTSFSLYFTIYFIGLLISNIVGLDLLGNRAIYCLISIRFVVAGFLLHFLLKRWRLKSVFSGMVAMYLVLCAILLFFANINGGSNGCSPFKFVFEG